LPLELIGHEFRGGSRQDRARRREFVGRTVSRAAPARSLAWRSRVGDSTPAPDADRDGCRSPCARGRRPLRVQQSRWQQAHSDSNTRRLHDWLLFTYTAPFQVLQNAKWFQPILGSGSIALQSNSTYALLAAALTGAGIAVLPRFVAREHDQLVPVSDDVASHDILLITHPQVRRDPKARATADFLKQLATEPPGLC
jgi:DNA-binding transcriptional LysR family regulator